MVIPPYVIRTYQGTPSGMAVEVQEDAARGLKEPLTIERIPLARNRIQDDYQAP